ncbi:MAG: hypothetical protein JXD21_07110 [Candidatus Omnitrophica bacterium]|nr:hypothetical protein [Candidatus Omnitrophota bacterium]
MMRKRAVCLNCIDGRIQLPAISWIKENYEIEFVDMITEPGMNGILADKGVSIEDICGKIKLSIERNNAAMIFVVGHHDCKGNPVTEPLHKEQIFLGVERLKKEFPGLPVIGLWINRDWQGQQIT